MCRTTLNVSGDLSASVYVNRVDQDLEAETGAEPEPSAA